MKSSHITILAVIAVILAYVYAKSTWHNHEVKRDVKLAIEHPLDSIGHYKDKAGAEHTTVLQDKESLEVMRIAFGRQLDSVAKLIGIKDRRIKELEFSKIKMSGQLAAKVVRDTIHDTPTVTLRYDNSAIEAIIKQRGDSATMTYSVHFDLQRVVYWKRRWFLGKKHYIVDETCPDSNIHITNLKGFKIN